mmetsp:Transcript_24480/g.21736  ORF Transcript_24480/g.21736 Transcript_24480/m.21736 type:complete len:97 (+) Transcript_24480:837-1127(+)
MSISYMNLKEYQKSVNTIQQALTIHERMGLQHTERYHMLKDHQEVINALWKQYHEKNEPQDLFNSRIISGSRLKISFGLFMITAISGVAIWYFKKK